MLSLPPTAGIPATLRKQWRGVPATSLRFLAGGETSGRDNAAWDVAANMHAGGTPYETAKRFMATLWETFSQGSDPYPIESALEKVDRLYGRGSSSGIRRRGRPTADRDRRFSCAGCGHPKESHHQDHCAVHEGGSPCECRGYIGFRLSVQSLIWPEDVWYEGEESIGRIRRLWNAGIAAMPQAIGKAKGGSSQNPKFKHLFAGEPTPGDWSKWEKVPHWREGNSAVLLGHPINPLYVIEVEQGDRDFDRVIPFLHQTPVVRSHKSCHIYICCPSEPSRGGFYSSKDPDFPKASRFEFKGSGQYVVAPGSKHPSGDIYHRIDSAGDSILVVENIDAFLNEYFPEFFDLTPAAMDEDEPDGRVTAEELVVSGIEEQMQAVSELTERGQKTYNVLPPKEKPSWWEKDVEEMTAKELGEWEDYSDTIAGSAAMDTVPKNELSQLRKSEYYQVRRLVNQLQNIKAVQSGGGEKYTLYGQDVFLSAPLLAPPSWWRTDEHELERLFRAVLGEEKSRPVIQKLQDCGVRIAGACNIHGEIHQSHRRCRLAEHWMELTQTAVAIRQVRMPKVAGVGKYRGTWLGVRVPWKHEPMYRSKDVGAFIDRANKVVSSIRGTKKCPKGLIINRAFCIRLGRDEFEFQLRLLTLERNEDAGSVDKVVAALSDQLGLVVIGQTPDHTNQELATLQWMQDASETFGGFFDTDMTEGERVDAFAAYWYGTRRRHMTQAFESYKLILQRERKQKAVALCPYCGNKLQWTVVDPKHPNQPPHNLDTPPPDEYY